MGSKKPGKSIALACSACSCNLPITGTVPCLPPTAQGPGGDMQLIPGPGQHRGCLLGMGRTTGPTALKDFGTCFLSQLLGTQLWCWERICRNPLVSARLHEGEGRGTLSSSPNALPLASPGSHSHTSRPLHDILGPREAAGRRQRSHPVQTRELPHKERGIKPKHPFTNCSDAWLWVIKALPRSSSMRAYPGRNGTENMQRGG